MIRKIVLSLSAAACLGTLSVEAQWSWFNPAAAPYPVIQNQGFAQEIGGEYIRLPRRAQAVVRPDVWNLACHSSGLALWFTTNAPSIQVRYQSSSANYAMSHMPATGVSGVDLYRGNEQGGWDFCFDSFSMRDTILYRYKHLGTGSPPAEYRLYLPLYNGVKWLEVGVPEGYRVKFLSTSTRQPIVVYGTSIAQGACASRPGMAWCNLLQRRLQCPVIDLGFSGNGRLEGEVIDLINELDARLYLLDCLPNLTHLPTDSIQPIVEQAVRQIRERHPSTPILLVEHAGHSSARTDSVLFERYDHANRASRRAYEQLRREGVKGIHYLSREQLAFPADAWVDYVHPSDVGMARQAEVVERAVRKILHLSAKDSAKGER